MAIKANNIKNNQITLESKMVKNELKISGDDHYLNSIIVISSLAGQVMIKSKIEMTNTIIPINLTSGIYIVNVISEGDSIFSDKIIVG